MNIYALSTRPQALADIFAALHCQHHGEHVLDSAALCTALDELDARHLDLLVVADNLPDPAAIDALATLARRNAALGIVLIAANLDASLAARASNAGILVQGADPIDADVLRAAAERLHTRSANRPRGQILAFIAPKGGSGSTFVATNLGYTLASTYQKKVLLIDLDLRHGDASFFIAGSSANASVLDAMGKAGDLDAATLAACCIDVTSLYALLPAPADPNLAGAASAVYIDRVLDVASANYDYVILDFAPTLDPIATRALGRADQLFLVLQPMVSYVRDGLRLLTQLRALGVSNSNVRLLANRSDTNTDLPLKSIEDALGAHFYASLPNDFEHACAAVNLGNPVLRLAPGSPIARALLALGAKLAHVDGGHGSWLGRMFPHRQAGQHGQE